MRYFGILIILLFSIGISAQDISGINADLGLSDSLNYKSEIRIYQGGGTTNYSSLFRMLKNDSEKWEVQFYEHFAKVGEETQLRTKKHALKSENNLEFIFQSLVRSHILVLPGLSEIEWKLVKLGNIQKIKTTTRSGEEIEEYELLTTKIAILDGEGFKILAKGWNKTNEFEYANPDGYLKEYPEIDELIYMCEILNIIRNEFGIWN